MTKVRTGIEFSMSIIQVFFIPYLTRINNSRDRWKSNFLQNVLSQLISCLLQQIHASIGGFIIIILHPLSDFKKENCILSRMVFFALVIKSINKAHLNRT